MITIKDLIKPEEIKAVYQAANSAKNAEVKKIKDRIKQKLKREGSFTGKKEPLFYDKVKLKVEEVLKSNDISLLNECHKQISNIKLISNKTLLTLVNKFDKIEAQLNQDYRKGKGFVYYVGKNEFDSREEAEQYKKENNLEIRVHNEAEDAERTLLALNALLYFEDYDKYVVFRNKSKSSRLVELVVKNFKKSK